MAAVRGIILFALACLNLVALIIAFTTNLGTAESGASKAEYNVWYRCTRPTATSLATCTSTTDSQQPCGEAKDMAGAAQAFYIIVALVSLPLLVFSTFDFSGTMPQLPVLSGKLIIAIVAGVAAILALIAWPIAIALMTTKFCNANSAAKDASNFKWGPSPFFMLLSMLVSIGMAVVAMIVPGTSGSSSDPSK